MLVGWMFLGPPPTYMAPEGLFKITVEVLVPAWAVLNECWSPAQPQLCLAMKSLDPDLNFQTNILACPWPPSHRGPVGWSMDLTYRWTSWLSLGPALSSRCCLICTPGWTWPPSQDLSCLPCLDTVGLGPGRRGPYPAVGFFLGVLLASPEGAALPLLLSYKKVTR